jgi:glycosyltransferase involved in cell wall biosynthesis
VRVLFLTTSYPSPAEPASGVFVEEHARAAAEHAEVAVLHLDRSRGFGIRRDSGGEFPTWRASYPSRPVPVTLAGHAAAAVAGVRAARRAGFAPDLLHAHFFLAGAAAVALARPRRLPVVVTEQWSIFLPEDPAPLTPVLRRAARLAFERAQLVLPASEALRRGIEAVGIHGRFRVVPNVVDTELFAPAEAPPAGPPTLAAVGLLYEAKAYDVLLDAAALLARGGRRFRLEIVGDGPLRGELEAQAARLELGEVVRFRGFLPKPEVAALLRESHAFVLTSRYDNNPCALIEAQASGLPVVATAVGGIPELVDDRVGLLAQPGDAADVARRIERLLDGLDRYDRHAIARRARERFGRRHVGDSLAQAYADAVVLRRSA